MNDRKITDLLDKHADVLATIVSSNAAHIESALANHRFRVAQLVLHESPEPFVREVFNHLKNGLKQVIAEEPGLADAEDARCLLRMLNRMELAALEGKPL